ncbi:hypothetical protein L0657_25840 [Dyadobacter sp. CY345]|uniref:hypothetical protein n=1 Tax=Dyadobacter sp. CY345 TaxID=2909335 RepID=UPI001F15E0AD|nr:hypothetical protein [Dyadobacter sp. CY345]MCF2447402.1 hypothetical protein [Dyadobacter sp. CY345]
MHPKKQIVLGTEIGMRFQPEKFPAVIKDFSWFFSANNFSKIKLHVNIYSLKNNFPDKQLLNTDLYVDIVDFKTSWIKVDMVSTMLFLKPILLSPYNTMAGAHHQRRREC